MAPAHKISVLGWSLIETHNYFFLCTKSTKMNDPASALKELRALGKTYKWQNSKSVGNYRPKKIEQCWAPSQRPGGSAKIFWGMRLFQVLVIPKRVRLFRMSKSSERSQLVRKYNSKWQVHSTMCEH